MITFAKDHDRNFNVGRLTFIAKSDSQVCWCVRARIEEHRAARITERQRRKK